MRYEVLARACEAGPTEFWVLTPDLGSALEVAEGLRKRHVDMAIEIRSPSGKIISIDKFEDLAPSERV